MLCESLFQEMEFSNNSDLHSKYISTRSISLISSSYKYEAVSIEGFWIGLREMFGYYNNILRLDLFVFKCFITNKSELISYYFL
jgi:hypothetical protein